MFQTMSAAKVISPVVRSMLASEPTLVPAVSNITGTDEPGLLYCGTPAESLVSFTNVIVYKFWKPSRKASFTVGLIVAIL